MSVLKLNESLNMDLKELKEHLNLMKDDGLIIERKGINQTLIFLK